MGNIMDQLDAMARIINRPIISRSERAAEEAVELLRQQVNLTQNQLDVAIMERDAAIERAKKEAREKAFWQWATLIVGVAGIIVGIVW